MRTTADINILIEEEFNRVRNLVVDKNTDYDSAVFHPAGIFTDTTPEDQIRTRLDDKLKRLQNIRRSSRVCISEEGLHELLSDIAAYSILLIVAHRIDARVEAAAQHFDHLEAVSGVAEVAPRKKRRRRKVVKPIKKSVTRKKMRRKRSSRR
jgi:hypothetical protein